MKMKKVTLLLIAAIASTALLSACNPSTADTTSSGSSSSTASTSSEVSSTTTDELTAEGTIANATMNQFELVTADGTLTILMADDTTVEGDGIVDDATATVVYTADGDTLTAKTVTVASSELTAEGTIANATMNQFELVTADGTLTILMADDTAVEGDGIVDDATATVVYTADGDTLTAKTVTVASSELTAEGTIANATMNQFELVTADGTLTILMADDTAVEGDGIVDDATATVVYTADGDTLTAKTVTIK